MKEKCQMCSPNSMGEREDGKKNPHRHVILLDSIKYPNNFVIKSPIICLNPKNI